MGWEDTRVERGNEGAGEGDRHPGVGGDGDGYGGADTLYKWPILTIN